MVAAIILFQFGDAPWGAVSSFLPFILIFVIFYFLLFLPTQRRDKRQREMLANLKTGDRVVTTGGIRGTIVNIKEDTLQLRVPPQDVKLEFVRSAVASVETPVEK